MAVEGTAPGKPSPDRALAEEAGVAEAAAIEDAVVERGGVEGAEGAEAVLPEHIPTNDVSAEDAPLRAEARTRPEHQLCCGVAPSRQARKTIGETGVRACAHQRMKK